MTREPHINKGVTAYALRPVDLGRNKAKREARAKGWRHIGKAPRRNDKQKPVLQRVFDAMLGSFS